MRLPGLFAVPVARVYSDTPQQLRRRAHVVMPAHAGIQRDGATPAVCV